MSRLIKLPVTNVIVGDRHRKDLGEIDKLVASIRTVGLLHPIVVDDKHRLVAGQRRLEAWTRLHDGREPIPAHVVGTLTDLLRALAEQDENTCRKDFMPSEAVALGLALEAIERPKADARREDGNRRGGVGGKLPPTSIPTKTRDKVAPAVGLSPRTYDKAKSVVAASTDQTLPAPVRAAAKEAVAEMDRNGKVDGAYRKVEQAKVDASPVAEYLNADADLAASGYRRAVAKAIHAASRLPAELDAERTAEVVDVDTLMGLDELVASITDFARRVHRARKGLRVVNGGKQ